MERIIRNILLLIFISVGGCVNNLPDHIIRFGVPSLPENLNPLLATDAMSARVSRLLCLSLVDFDEHQQPVPQLADWSLLSPRRYRFTLKKGLPPFTDGRPLTADDVAATYSYVLDPGNASPLRSALSLIDQIRVLDTRTIEFELSRADPHFPAYLTLGILPANLLGAQDSLGERPLGNGPFELIHSDGRNVLRLRRRSDNQLLEFVAVRDPVVRVLKLLRGEIHLVQNDLPPELFGYLETQPDIALTSRPGTNFTYLGFNLENPATGDSRVRRAIAHAIDRDAIARHVFRGRVTLAESLFPPQHWLGLELPRHGHDTQQARRLLLEAGYDTDNPLVLDYKTSSDPFRLRLAAVIQDQLSEVGIRVRLRSYDWGTFFGDIKAGNFQLYSLTWVGLKTPDSFRYLFHSDSVPPSGANRGRYRSSAADSLIEEAETVQDVAGQSVIYHRLQQVLLEELPYVPLWYEDHVAALRKEVRGYPLADDGNYDGLTEIQWTR